MVDETTQARSAKCGIDYQLMPVLSRELARKEYRIATGRLQSGGYRIWRLTFSTSSFISSRVSFRNFRMRSRRA